MKIIKFLMFNRLTTSYLNSDFWILRWNKRIKTIIVEMWYTLSVFVPYLMILIIPTMFLGDPFPKSFGLIDIIRLGPFCVLMTAIINKDFFNGQSVVHRRLGYQVVDIKTNQPASPLKCMLRNVTAPIWPIEGVFALAYPSRRFGDFIAGTVLIEVEPSDPELVLQEIRNVRFDRQTKLTLLFSVLWTLTFMILFEPRIRF